jgi:hypothetical protein
MGRVLANWLQGYRVYCEEQEAPESFHLWSGLSVLASAVRRNVWKHQGIYLLYPNQYIILVAESGKIGKSTVLRMGKKILRHVDGVLFGPDSGSREDFARSMSKSHAGNASAMTVYSSEFSSLTETSGITMFQWLTDIYDCDDEWIHSTIGRGKNDIKEPCLNILAGTTPSWIAEGFPASVLSHGFTARTIFVFEDKLRKANPEPDRPNDSLVQSLINDLNHIAELEGAFQWTDESARARYHEIYKETIMTPPEDYRLIGFHNRKVKAHVLKIAMLLSLAEDDSLALSKRDINAAYELLNGVERTMPQAFSAVGKYEFASDLERIRDQIDAVGEITLREVLKANYHIGTEEVKKILHSCKEMGWVTLENVKGVWTLRSTSPKRPRHE